MLTCFSASSFRVLIPNSVEFRLPPLFCFFNDVFNNDLKRQCFTPQMPTGAPVVIIPSASEWLGLFCLLFFSLFPRLFRISALLVYIIATLLRHQCDVHDLPILRKVCNLVCSLSSICLLFVHWWFLSSEVVYWNSGSQLVCIPFHSFCLYSSYSLCVETLTQITFLLVIIFSLESRYFLYPIWRINYRYWIALSQNQIWIAVYTSLYKIMNTNFDNILNILLVSFFSWIHYETLQQKLLF